MKITDSQIATEQHPLPPFLPENARLLMLGSFPPPRARWVMDFYYPNFQNDMWRIIGLAFFNDKDYFVAENKKSFCESRIRSFLTEKGIALADTAKEIIRQKDNASDKFLEVVSAIDLDEVLGKLPLCRAIVTTGQKATDTLLTMVEAEEPKTGTYSEIRYKGLDLRIYRMPSSSRAYPKPLTGKADVYKTMFNDLQML